MKYLIKPIAIVILFSNTLAGFGQTTQSTNAIISTDYLGSSNANDVNFKGNGNQYMRLLQSSGFLGIGTTSPSGILHTVASGVKTVNFSGNILTNTATTSTNAIRKTGLEILSTGAWSGGTSVNMGLYISAVTGGDYNYDAIFNGGGNVGIGMTAPVYKLDVTGEINMSSGSAYRIDGNKVLWYKTGGISTLFIGVGAGHANAGGGNTFVGNDAGRNTTFDAGANTFMGYSAGYGNNGNSGIGGAQNTYLGSETGYATNTNSNNTFVGYRAGYTNATANNTFIGSGTGILNTSGTLNAYLGVSAGGGNQTGSGNTLMGAGAGSGAGNPSPNSFSSNSFFGSESGVKVTTGSYNVLLGAVAGYSITTGADNVIVGYKAGSSITSGDQNCFMGRESGYRISTGTSNILIGYAAGAWNQTGGSNTICGYQAGFGNNTSIQNNSNNAFFGFRAGYAVTTGGNNVFMGYQAGDINTTGAGNTYLGYNADGCAACSTITNATALGYNSVVGASNSLVLGGTGSDQPNVGIGVITPKAMLSVGSTAVNSSLNIYQFGYGAAKSNTAFTRAGTLAQSNESSNPFALYVAAIGAASSANMVGVLQTGIEASCNCGVLSLQGNGGTVGIGTTTPSYKLDVQGGDINASGSVRSAGVALTSDQKFKTNIEAIPNAISIINKLRPTSYYWDSINVYGMNFTNQKQYGLISQEVEKVLPELIYNTDKNATYDTSGNLLTQAVSYKSMNYIAFIPILMKGIQEQQNTIDSLLMMVSDLKGGGQRGNNNGGDGQGNKEAINQIELANNSQPILYQNEPNPFDGSTVIRYFIPENITGSAFVVFYDMYGKEVNKLEIREKGFGKIEANTENLASGIYSYSILVDGKSIDTKKMLKSK